MKNVLVGLIVVILIGIGSFFAWRITPLRISLLSLLKPAVTSSEVVQQIQRISRLETTMYTIETIVEQDEQGGINTPLGRVNLGNDRLILIAYGHVTAGIDLEKLMAENVHVSADGTHVTITLPPVEILHADLDEQKTHVYDRDTSLMHASLSLESDARRKGVSKILATACKDGIMERANQDTQKAVEHILTLSGFAEVSVKSSPVPTCPVTPP